MSSAAPKDEPIDLMREMIEIVRQELAVDACAADQIAAAIMRGMRRHFGAQKIYIPEQTRQEKSERDAAIKREYNGHNLEEVKHAHNVSRTTVYRACGK